MINQLDESPSSPISLGHHLGIPTDLAEAKQYRIGLGHGMSQVTHSFEADPDGVQSLTHLTNGAGGWGLVKQ